MVKTLTVKRVIYGRRDTPVESREYKSEFSTVIGNMNEWKEFAKKTGYNKVEFVEKDGLVRETICI